MKIKKIITGIAVIVGLPILALLLYTFSQISGAVYSSGRGDWHEMDLFRTYSIEVIFDAQLKGSTVGSLDEQTIDEITSSKTLELVKRKFGDQAPDMTNYDEAASFDRNPLHLHITLHIGRDKRDARRLSLWAVATRTRLVQLYYLFQETEYRNCDPLIELFFPSLAEQLAMGAPGKHQCRNKDRREKFEDMTQSQTAYAKEKWFTGVTKSKSFIAEDKVATEKELIAYLENLVGKMNPKKKEAGIVEGSIRLMTP